MKQYTIPTPIVDQRETDSIAILNERFAKLCEPNRFVKLGKNLGKVVPKQVKSFFSDLGESITEKELYNRIMEYLSSGFKDLQEMAAKYTLPRKTIIKSINETVYDNNISNPSEFCLARSYDIARLVSQFKDGGMLEALVEGAATGALGFAGLVPNIILCTFICFRAVQTVATFYGYDVKNDPSELVIATEVFTNALSPATANSGEVSDIITKIMAFAEIATLKDLLVKPYAEMAAHGGIALLIVQLRALANAAAKKGLEQAGKKGLEESLFKSVFKQIGKGLGKKSVGKMIPGISAAIGAAFDIAQMKTVVTYADVFYQKRFLLEKEHNIDKLIGPPNDIVYI